MFRLALLTLLLPIMSLTAASQKESVRTVDPAEITIKTDQTEYVAEYILSGPDWPRYKFIITTRFENRTGAPIYFDRCGPDAPSPYYDVVRDNKGEITTSVGYRPIYGCVAHNNPIIVLPGETRVDKIDIYGPNAFFDGKTVPEEELIGQFRLTYTAHLCREIMTCAPLGTTQYSNVFSVSLKRKK